MRMTMRYERGTSRTKRNEDKGARIRYSRRSLFLLLFVGTIALRVVHVSLPKRGSRVERKRVGFYNVIFRDGREMKFPLLRISDETFPIF